jgi:hypothetical protein
VIFSIQIKKGVQIKKGECLMSKKLGIVVVLLAIALVGVLVISPTIANAKRGGEGGRGDGPIVYVTSQGLYYDSIVTADPVPPNGPFQQLFPPGTNPDWPEGETLSTEYGPGTPGHHGGRWWVDVNKNGEMDEGDHFFVCPLLGPGRTAP